MSTSATNREITAKRITLGPEIGDKRLKPTVIGLNDRHTRQQSARPVAATVQI